MMQTATRFANPAAEAKAVLARYWNGRIPVDVELIARQMGVKVEALDPIAAGGSLSGISGEIELLEDQPVVRVNAADPQTRRRFTIAHELGHLMLGHLADGKKFRDPSKNYTLGNYDPKERDANYFAAALLMPDDAVRAYAAGMETPSATTLAKAFGVSKAAMGIKLKMLGIIPQWATI